MFVTKESPIFMVKIVKLFYAIYQFWGHRLLLNQAKKISLFKL